MDEFFSLVGSHDDVDAAVAEGHSNAVETSNFAETAAVVEKHGYSNAVVEECAVQEHTAPQVQEQVAALAHTGAGHVPVDTDAGHVPVDTGAGHVTVDTGAGLARIGAGLARTGADQDDLMLLLVEAWIDAQIAVGAYQWNTGLPVEESAVESQGQFLVLEQMYYYGQTQAFCCSVYQQDYVVKVRMLE